MGGYYITNLNFIDIMNLGSMFSYDLKGVEHMSHILIKMNLWDHYILDPNTENYRKFYIMENYYLNFPKNKSYDYITKNIDYSFYYLYYPENSIFSELENISIMRSKPKIYYTRRVIKFEPNEFENRVHYWVYAIDKWVCNIGLLRKIVNKHVDLILDSVEKYIPIPLENVNIDIFGYRLNQRDIVYYRPEIIKSKFPKLDVSKILITWSNEPLNNKSIYDQIDLYNKVTDFESIKSPDLNIKEEEKDVFWYNIYKIVQYNYLFFQKIIIIIINKIIMFLNFIIYIINKLYRYIYMHELEDQYKDAIIFNKFFNINKIKHYKYININWINYYLDQYIIYLSKTNVDLLKFYYDTYYNFLNFNAYKNDPYYYIYLTFLLSINIIIFFIFKKIFKWYIHYTYYLWCSLLKFKKYIITKNENWNIFTIYYSRFHTIYYDIVDDRVMQDPIGKYNITLDFRSFWRKYVKMVNWNEVIVTKYLLKIFNKIKNIIYYILKKIIIITITINNKFDNKIKLFFKNPKKRKLILISFKNDFNIYINNMHNIIRSNIKFQKYFNILLSDIWEYFFVHNDKITFDSILYKIKYNIDKNIYENYKWFIIHKKNAILYKILNKVYKINIINDKTKRINIEYSLIYYDFYILKEYIALLWRPYIIKKIKIIIYIIIYSLKYIIIKLLKLCFKYIFKTSINYFIIYFIINVYYFLYKIIKKNYAYYYTKLYNKYRIYQIFFFHMSYFYYFYQQITKILYINEHYTRVNIMHFPEKHLSNFILNIFRFIDIIVNIQNIKSFKILNYIFMLFTILFYYILNFIGIIFNTSFNILNKLIYIFIKNRIYILKNIYNYKIWINSIIYIFIIYIIIININIVIYFIILFLIINKINIKNTKNTYNKIIYYLGFTIYLIIDLLYFINIGNIIRILLKIVKYILIYPILIYILLILSQKLSTFNAIYNILYIILYNSYITIDKYIISVIIDFNNILIDLLSLNQLKLIQYWINYNKEYNNIEYLKKACFIEGYKHQWNIYWGKFTMRYKRLYVLERSDYYKIIIINPLLLLYRMYQQMFFIMDTYYLFSHTWIRYLLWSYYLEYVNKQNLLQFIIYNIKYYDVLLQLRRIIIYFIGINIKNAINLYNIFNIFWNKNYNIIYYNFLIITRINIPIYFQNYLYIIIKFKELNFKINYILYELYNEFKYIFKFYYNIYMNYNKIIFKAFIYDIWYNVLYNYNYYTLSLIRNIFNYIILKYNILNLYIYDYILTFWRISNKQFLIRNKNINNIDVFNIRRKGITIDWIRPKWFANYSLSKYDSKEIFKEKDLKFYLYTPIRYYKNFIIYDLINKNNYYFINDYQYYNNLDIIMNSNTYKINYYINKKQPYAFPIAIYIIITILYKIHCKYILKSFDNYIILNHNNNNILLDHLRNINKNDKKTLYNFSTIPRICDEFFKIQLNKIIDEDSIGEILSRDLNISKYEESVERKDAARKEKVKEDKKAERRIKEIEEEAKIAEKIEKIEDINKINNKKILKKKQIKNIKENIFNKINIYIKRNYKKKIINIYKKLFLNDKFYINYKKNNNKKNLNYLLIQLLIKNYKINKKIFNKIYYIYFYNTNKVIYKKILKKYKLLSVNYERNYIKNSLSDIELYNIFFENYIKYKEFKNKIFKNNLFKYDNIFKNFLDEYNDNTVGKPIFSDIKDIKKNYKFKNNLNVVNNMIKINKYLYNKYKIIKNYNNIFFNYHKLTSFNINNDKRKEYNLFYSFFFNKFNRIKLYTQCYGDKKYIENYIDRVGWERYRDEPYHMTRNKIRLDINESCFYYLQKKFYDIYHYEKWIDNIILDNNLLDGYYKNTAQCIFYENNKNNNKYYYVTTEALESNNIWYYYILIFIIVIYWTFCQKTLMITQEYYDIDEFFFLTNFFNEILFNLMVYMYQYDYIRYFSYYLYSEFNLFQKGDSGFTKSWILFLKQDHIYFTSNANMEYNNILKKIPLLYFFDKEFYNIHNREYISANDDIIESAFKYNPNLSEYYLFYINSKIINTLSYLFLDFVSYIYYIIKEYIINKLYLLIIENIIFDIKLIKIIKIIILLLSLLNITNIKNKQYNILNIVKLINNISKNINRNIKIIK